METEYLGLLSNVLYLGFEREDRTGVGTISLFGENLHFYPIYGENGQFPLLTTKRVHFKSIACELLWILSGETNIKPLNDAGVHIWDEWADANGDLGKIYGYQWRKRPDQIRTLIEGLKNNPFSRRHLVSAWNVADLDCMALPPCHLLFQCYVHNDGTLEMQVYQRSADMFLGVPFNIASYYLLLMMLCQQCDLKPGALKFSFGDCHIYNNHIAQVKEQLSRDPLPLPKLIIKRKPKDLFSYVYEDFELIDYNPHPAIKGEVAV